MVKIALQIRITLENLEKVYTNHPHYSFHVKIKCLNCGEESDKWHDITESETFPSRIGKSEVHYMAKCKLCTRENSLDIVEGSNGEYLNDDQGNFKTLVVFDCRGIEPINFEPRQGWIGIAESGKTFNDIDLTEKEWADYDDKSNQSVGIYEFESKFIKTK